jgi:Restriction endonuclease fold toxin 7
VVTGGIGNMAAGVHGLSAALMMKGDGGGDAAGGAARGGASVVRTGQAGEAAVRSVADIGDKTLVRVAGRTRIPDGLTSTALSEVKNVNSLSYTKQLRDFAAHARANGLKFDLWVKPTTQLSGPLEQEISSRAINLQHIP